MQVFKDSVFNLNGKKRFLEFCGFMGSRNIYLYNIQSENNLPFVFCLLLMPIIYCILLEALILHSHFRKIILEFRKPKICFQCRNSLSELNSFLDYSSSIVINYQAELKFCLAEEAKVLQRNDSRICEWKEDIKSAEASFTFFLTKPKKF